MPESAPLGREVDWTPARQPGREPLRGERVLLRPISPDDADALYALSHQPGGDPAIWTYLPYGPFESADAYRAALAAFAELDHTLFFTICGLPDEAPLGIASYLRIKPEWGSIEIGHIWFGPSLQRTAAATEAIFLLMRHAFDDLGYRRFEWKCNALNAASRRAAERFGFTFEGVFLNHMVVKGRNRDTAWYAITVEEWPQIKSAYERWLAPGNFDADGRQLHSLQALRSAQTG